MFLDSAERALENRSTPLLPSLPEPRRVTLEEWLAIPEEEHAELIDGRIVYQSMPIVGHGRALLGIAEALRGPYDRRASGDDGLGGWWLSTDVGLLLGGIGCRPDLMGWRRSKHTGRPREDERGVVTVAPDWICEILSPSTRHTDRGPKRLAYYRAGVGHYWLLDPETGELTTFCHGAEGYVLEVTAGPGERVRAAPFDAVDLDLNRVLGIEPPEEPMVRGEPGAGAAAR